MLDPIRPELERGNATQFVKERALPYLSGHGCDIGCGEWKIKSDAVGIDMVQNKGVDIIIKDENWDVLKDGEYDYVFSSHCLEHIDDWQLALENWIKILSAGGVLFLYLPYPLKYNRWSKNHLKTHKHDFHPAMIMEELFKNNMRIVDFFADEYASFGVVARKFGLAA